MGAAPHPVSYTHLLLRRTLSTRQMAVVLVFLPFFFSMAVTHDVSLITFVPFALIVLRLAGQQQMCIRDSA